MGPRPVRDVAGGGGPSSMPASAAGTLPEALRGSGAVTAVELRPPLQGLAGPTAMDAWIGLYHQVRSLLREGYYLFLTDNAVGQAEEENLAHLQANLADEVDAGRVVPILTAKHSLDYCLLYAERAWSHGIRALVVLGGDRTVGPPRCVSHGYELRRRIRERIPDMALGGWVNPHKDPEQQAAFVADPDFCADFWLAQVVSHHSAERAEALLKAFAEAGVSIPGLFGIFFYRSARPQTLERLGSFFPVPVEQLTREFQKGLGPEEICRRSVEALRRAGARHLYFSNLDLGRAARTLRSLLR